MGLGQKIKISKLVYGGDGIARQEGYVIFVPYTAPGDEIQVRVTERKKKYLRGELESLVSSSPIRTNPKCKFYFCPGKNTLPCGSCNWQHLDYKEQVNQKVSILSEMLAAVTGVKKEINVESVPMTDPWHYRNKVQFPVSTTRLGYYSANTHKVVNITACPVQPRVGDEILSVLHNLQQKYPLPGYNEHTHTGFLRHVIIRYSLYYNDITLIFVTRTEGNKILISWIDTLKSKFPQICAVYQNINPNRTNVILGIQTVPLFFRHEFREKINFKGYTPLELTISPTAFFQTNTVQAEKLTEKVIELVNPQKNITVLDLYSGMGMIGLSLARYVDKVYAVEENPDACMDARKIAEINHIKNFYLYPGRVEDVLIQRQKLPVKQDTKHFTVILDPPRSGCSKQVIDQIIRFNADKIIYVSCNPSTLCRDLKLILPAGYQLTKTVFVDMFPQTSHIECIVLLTLN